MALADLVLVPGTFVQNTVAEFLPQKKVALAPYGVDLDFWRGVPKQENRSFRFVFAGQVSVRKGTPLLLQAWRKAGLREAELQLIGSWRLADSVRRETPAGVRWIPPLSYPKLRAAYQSADVFVLPSYFEGLALALLEALACELPAIATEAAAGSELELDKCGRLLRTGHVDDLVDALRWCHANQDEVARMKGVARRTAERFTWERYRSAVTEAAAPFA
jgi:glycosyltransferase involved in cell wall biosynthesis